MPAKFTSTLASPHLQNRRNLILVHPALEDGKDLLLQLVKKSQWFWVKKSPKNLQLVKRASQIWMTLREDVLMIR